MKYRTIVIDPPWEVIFNMSNLTVNGTKYKKLPYATMTDNEIRNFPIDNYAEKKCWLFMWSTHRKLPTALNIIEQWGFHYDCILAWNKHRGPTVNGICRDMEPCIIAHRGNLRLSNKIPLKLIIDSLNTSNSEKPRKFYDMVRKSAPKPRIDIFARRRHYGFNAYGDQVESDTQERIL